MKVTINTDLVRQFRPHICMPCYGGMLTEACFLSYIKWGNMARQLGIEWTVETMTNESLISRARNILTAKFLSNPTSTHLMFIDADIGWEPWHLLALLNHDVDIIGGLYPMKTLPIKWCVNAVAGAQDLPNGLTEVSKTGTGFMLIRRSVFDKMNQHPSVRPFRNDVNLPVELDQYLRNYFDTEVRDDRYLSEDWTFCANWRDLGGRVWVDRRVLLRHVGSYVFDFENQNRLYDSLQDTVGAWRAVNMEPENSNSDVQLPKAEIQAPAEAPPAPAPRLVSTNIQDLAQADML